MPFNVFLGEMIGAILLPIFEAIFALLTPIFTVIAELLVALLTPIFAPVLELLLWIFMLLSGAFFGLIWALLTALGLARYASGVSKGAYLLSATCLLYLLVGFVQLLTNTPYEENLVSQTGGLTALIVAGLGLIIGLGAARSPDERILHREERLARNQTKTKGDDKHAHNVSQPSKGKAIFKAALFGGIIVAAFIWFWPSPEPVLPKCTTSDRLRQLASTIMSERGSEPTAEVIHPDDCQ